MITTAYKAHQIPSAAGAITKFTTQKKNIDTIEGCVTIDGV
jgi:hypothetical protein